MKILGIRVESHDVFLFAATPVASLVVAFAAHADMKAAENFQKEQKPEIECIARNIAREEIDNMIVASSRNTGEELVMSRSEAAPVGTQPAPSC